MNRIWWHSILQITIVRNPPNSEEPFLRLAGIRLALVWEFRNLGDWWVQGIGLEGLGLKTWEFRLCFSVDLERLLLPRSLSIKLQQRRPQQ